MLTDYGDVFPEKLPDGLPPERNIEMKIELEEGAKPKIRPIYKLSVTELAEMKKTIATALAHGFIRPSVSPWGLPVLFTSKNDGSLRMCIDYRALNKQTIQNKVPLPRIDEVWDELSGAKYFSTIDLRDGHHQIRVRTEYIEKTAFRTQYGQFEYLVTPFGLSEAPGCFQTLMNNIFRPHLDEFILVYLDYILIFIKTEEEHLKHIKVTLETLRQNNLYAKLAKCHFFQTELEYLGHRISGEGIRVDPKTIIAVTEWDRPTTVKQIQSFLGLCNYYRKFVRDFAKIASPLTDLTKK